ncbi:GumC family protein [Caminibacter pacificus]|uniref:non-specific protein-tyrosine kinase n=1 Tax=Caminibacter pacificus TaxID=1424653 RepID=A0AAJ4RBI9_9BACT|nr:polysaccharide biosynthesis tyrosine autokinase [Caminibacter pacificus]QCI29027.1 polysaccharide biosynthesis tyrosine autokinase [Caminibacter pacificus]ROR39156.1 capsular exopolysaccharide synthesis family protein [Caminibacter pacificus]
MSREIQNTEEIDLRELFSILRNNKLLIFLFLFLGVLFSAIFVYFATPQYKTNATIEVTPAPKQLNAQDLISQALGMDNSASLETEQYIITSRSMIAKTLDKVNFTKRYYITKNLKTTEIYYKNSPFKVEIKKGKNLVFKIVPLNDVTFVLKVKNDKLNIDFNNEYKFNEWIKTPYFELKVIKLKPLDDSATYKFVWLDKIETAKNLQKKLSASPVSKNADILNIIFSDNIPQRAANFVNELINIYIQQSVKLKTAQANQTLKFIDNQLKIISKKLAESELALENFKKKNKVVDLTIEAQGIIQKLNDLDTKINELILKENTIDFIEKQIQGNNDIKLISSGLVDDPILSDLITQLQQLILKKETLLIEYTPKHPDVIKVNDQIRSLVEMIKNRINSIRVSIQNQMQTLLKIKKEYTKMLENLPQNERKLADLLRTYQVNEKIYSYLLEKRAATAIAKASIVSNNRVIDPALVPQKPYKPKKVLILVIGFILGLILGIVVALVKEFLSTKIKSKEDVEKLTDVPIVGTVPHFKKKDTVLKTLNAPKSAVAEAFRAIRTNLKFISPEKLQVIVVTSTISGEGKTTVASNLAGIYSLSGKKTLLVNLDMRKPTLHKVFNVDNNIGISSVLVNEKTVDEVIKKTKYSNLDIITSGPIPPNPGELIQSRKMDEVIEELRGKYDIVIFDTPPVGLVVDAMHLLEKSDANIYLFRAEYSKKDFVKTLNDLKQKGFKHLSIVINDISKKHGNYYGYGYGYGGYVEE